jgi:hypothetical protein
MRAAVQLLLPVQVDCDDRRRLYLTRVRYEGVGLGDYSPLPSICHLVFFVNSFLCFLQNIIRLPIDFATIESTLILA